MQFKTEFYQAFADYIFKHTGIHYAEANFYQLDARILKLMKFLDTDKEAEVLQALQAVSVKPAVHQMIIDLATNNETYFFRDPVVFQSIQNELVPQWLAKLDKGESLRIWSAAASSGQEIYSVLMNIESQRPGAISLPGFQFRATDISQQILNKAKTGIYTQLEVQRGLPILLLTKYFKQTDKGEWQIDPRFSKAIDFSSFNLLLDPYPVNHFDLVLCRNVLIYQKKENKSLVLAKIYSALKPGGLLILGNTENTYGLNQDFVSQNLGGIAVYQKPSEQPVKKAG